jgi:hypothetical protein
MRAILLAAGRGLRMQQPQDTELPKCLLRFGGRSLLERHLQLLRGAGVEEVVLALGFSHQQVEAELDSLRWQPRPEIVLNPGFELGSVLTVHTVVAAMTRGGDVLLMDADVLYHERIMLAEEAFLEQRFGDEFREWAARTPAVIPDPRAWLYSNLPFSLRNVLRREYNNAFGVVLAMFLLDAASDSAAQHRLTTGYWWERLMFVGFVLWLILRTLKRRTEVLRVAGR